VCARVYVLVLLPLNVPVPRVSEVAVVVWSLEQEDLFTAPVPRGGMETCARTDARRERAMGARASITAITMIAQDASKMCLDGRECRVLIWLQVVVTHFKFVTEVRAVWPTVRDFDHDVGIYDFHARSCRCEVPSRPGKNDMQYSYTLEMFLKCRIFKHRQPDVFDTQASMQQCLEDCVETLIGDLRAAVFWATRHECVS